MPSDMTECLWCGKYNGERPPSRPAREQAGREAVAAHTYAARAERILALAVEVAGKYGTIAA